MIHEFFELLRAANDCGYAVRKSRLSCATVASMSSSHAEAVATLLRDLATMVVEDPDISALWKLRVEFGLMHEILAVAGEAEELIAAVHFARLQIFVVMDAVEEVAMKKAAVATPAATFACQQVVAETRADMQMLARVLEMTAASFERRCLLLRFCSAKKNISAKSQ